MTLPSNPETRPVAVGPVVIGGGAPAALIAGPCVVEDEETPLRIARRLREISDQLMLPIIFKASYDKANRTSVSSFRGIGMDEGLAVLAKVREETGLPLLSDVHSVDQVAKAAEVLDCLQIPAFLCRQTDLLVAAGESGKAVNIKKGQFLAPELMAHAAAKVESAAGEGRGRVLLTERGTSFGSGDLVVDMRSLVTMRESGWPVVYDATHSVQKPGGLGHDSHLVE